jgi:hypothetical protein
MFANKIFTTWHRISGHSWNHRRFPQVERHLSTSSPLVSHHSSMAIVKKVHSSEDYWDIYFNSNIYKYFSVHCVYHGCVFLHLGVSAIVYPAPTSIALKMERAIHVWGVSSAYYDIATWPSPISFAFPFALDIGGALDPQCWLGPGQMHRPTDHLQVWHWSRHLTS